MIYYWHQIHKLVSPHNIYINKYKTHEACIKLSKQYYNNICNNPSYIYKLRVDDNDAYITLCKIENLLINLNNLIIKIQYKKTPKIHSILIDLNNLYINIYMYYMQLRIIWLQS